MVYQRIQFWFLKSVAPFPAHPIPVVSVHTCVHVYTPMCGVYMVRNNLKIIRINLLKWNFKQNNKDTKSIFL